jgi:hypothetical protein
VLNQGKATSLAFTVPQSRRFPCALTTNQNGRLLGTIRTIVAGIARVVQAVRDRAKKRNPETNPQNVKIMFKMSAKIKILYQVAVKCKLERGS